jgi:hypothetical protein
MQMTTLIGLSGFLMHRKEGRPFLNLQTVQKFQYYKFMKQRVVDFTATPMNS